MEYTVFSMCVISNFKRAKIFELLIVDIVDLYKLFWQRDLLAKVEFKRGQTVVHDTTVPS